MILFPLTDKKTPAVPEGTSWRDYKGLVKTKLTGVMIPQGVVVLDIDLYKGVTLEQVDAALGVALDWDNSELQDTRSGGRHYVFKLPGGVEVVNGSDLLGVVGFDSRAAGKGYIATGEGYEPLCFLHSSVVEALHDVDSWPMLPMAAAERLRVGAEVSGEDLDDLESAIAAKPLELRESEVSAYMSALTEAHAECSDTWLRVGMALYHQFSGSEEGWEWFDEFSRKCPSKYDARTNRRRWESFGGSRANPVRFASIIELAGGQRVVKASKFQQALGELRAVDNEKALAGAMLEAKINCLGDLDEMLLLGVVKEKVLELRGQKLTDTQAKRLVKKCLPRKEGAFFNDYVFLTVSGEYLHRETKARMGPRAFDVQHSRETPLDGDGNPQRATAYADSRIECVHDGLYAPMFGDFFEHEGVRYFNTYKPNLLERVPAGEVAEKVNAHIAHLLPCETEQQILINYLAHNVQHPGVKIPWAIILQGVQGDGKSFFAEMMRQVLGFGNANIIGAESLDEKFTAFAEGRCMVFIEELKLDNFRKYETINKLKPFITNTVVSVRKMHRDAYEVLNTANYMAFTNFQDALPIDDSDRRYCVLFSQWQGRTELEAFIAQNPSYYPDLYDAMRNGAGEILDWLLSVKIPESFYKQQRAPNTAAKTMMRDLHRGEDWDELEQAIRHFSCADINSEVVNVTKLKNLVNTSFEDFPDFPKDKRLVYMLQEMGYTHLKRVQVDGKRARYWCKSKSFEPNANSVDDVPF